jgi:Uma2 family endonuclease
MPSEPRILTADDVLDLPVPDDAIGYEFVDGQPVLVMPASPIHGRLAGHLYRRLYDYVVEHGLPGWVCYDCGYVLGLPHDRERMRGPDVSYVAQENVDAHANPERLFRCVPELAVEVDVSSGRKAGGQQRILDYIEAGIPLIWAIDSRSRSAMIYHADGSARLLREDDVLDGENVVPGFRLALAELFR